MMCFAMMILFALAGAWIGYKIGSRSAEPAEAPDTLTKEERENIRQIINLLTFTGEPQERSDI